MTPRLSDLLARLEPVVREEMLKVAVPNCCIATVAVLCRVFKHHGFKARGVACSVIVRNPQFLKCRERGMLVPSDPEAMRAWMEATGSHVIGIVPESATESALRGYDAFGGHLLCHVQDRLVDASLAQASRPAKSMVLPPFITVEASPRFLAGTGMLVGMVNGCEVEYRPLRDSKWRHAPDWVRDDRYRSVVNAILERAKPACVSISQ